MGLGKRKKKEAEEQPLTMKKENRTSEEKQISQSKGEAPWWKGLIIALAVVITVGFVTEIVFIAIATCNGKPIADALNATFLSTGITIIGFAIAIWAGLNILSAVSRKDVETAKAELLEISESLKQAKGILVEQLKKQLMDSLRATAKFDYFSLTFVEKFSKMVLGETYAESVSEIVRVDSEFAAVFYRHDAEHRDAEQWKMTNELIKRINAVLDKYPELPKELEDYLKHRLAETHFYQGYTSLGKRMYSVDFTAKFYEEELKQLEADHKGVHREEYDYGRMKVYLQNTIAESYSLRFRYIKDEHDPEYKTVFESGKDAFDKVMYLLRRDNNYDREVYYRNYACFLQYYYQTYKDSAVREKILDLFVKAIQAQVRTGEPPKIREYREALEYLDSLDDRTDDEQKYAEWILNIATTLYPENVKILAIGVRILKEDNPRREELKTKLDFLVSAI